nr:hypothetical protein [uncultured Sphingosinicella sp.]
MKKGWGLLLFTCGAVLSFPLQAQDEPPIGSRLGKRSDIRIEQDPKLAVQAAHRLAGCIYLKRPTDVRAALSSLDGADARRRMNKIGSSGTCINLMVSADEAHAQSVSFPPDIYRGMLAEAALRQDYQRTALDALPKQATYSRPWFATTGRPLAVDEMGACVADTNPTGVRALLATTAETAEEKRAASELFPSLGSCLTIGAKLNANRQSLRAALAEALYHRAATPAVAAATTQ